MYPSTGALLSEYFVIVKKIIKDMVPKATMRFFVVQSQMEVDGAVIATLYHKVCVFVRVRVRVRACEFMCVRARALVYVCARSRVCLFDDLFPTTGPTET